MRDFAKSIPSETEEGSPGPFEKNIPSGLLERTSFKEAVSYTHLTLPTSVPV